MHLSRFTDYAVRVLIFAAINPERLVTLQEMSVFYDISLAHLRKVVHKLGQLGYLKTYRGKYGSMRLQRSSAEINIGQVIGVFEGRDQLIDCSGLSCVGQPACALPRLLRRGQQAFYTEMEKYTLADIVVLDRVPLMVQAVEKRQHPATVIVKS